MNNGWSQERRKRQSLLIHRWNPSNRSTGPRTDVGKARSSLNALKHGGRSKSTNEMMSSFKQIFQVQSLIQIQAKEKVNNCKDT